MEEDKKFEEDYLKTLGQFIGVMRSIFAISGSESKTMLKWLKSYETFFVKSEKRPSYKLQVPIFVEMFKTHRQKFLDICDEATFIEKAKLSIWFGEKDEKLTKKNLRLPIYVCYTKALALTRQADAQLEKDDEKDAHILESPEYTMYYELLYYLVDLVYRSLQVEDWHKSDLKTLKQNMKELRLSTNIDDDNEVPGSSLFNVVKVIGKAMGQTGEVDEKKFNESLNKTTEMLSNPTILETATSLLGNFNDIKPQEGQTITDVLKTTVDKLGPVLEKAMPMSNEPVPEGVTIDTFAKNLKESLATDVEQKIEIVPNDKWEPESSEESE